MTQDLPFDPDAGLSPEELAHEKQLEAEAEKKNPEQWKKNNERLSQFIALLDSIDPKQTEELAQQIEKFIQGEINWAQLKGISPTHLFKMAEFGHLQFKRGKFKEAELVFKGLSGLDHRQPYYHLVLGAIYQRQSKWLDALTEYSTALFFDPKQVAAYANRGEVWYKVQNNEEALNDLNSAIVLDPASKNSWAVRARFLKKKIEEEIQKQKK